VEFLDWPGSYSCDGKVVHDRDIMNSIKVVRTSVKRKLCSSRYQEVLCIDLSQ
jgi:hypothetical protein